ncbi:MAG: sugar transferase [Sphingomonas sp.]|uniref:sugar transferase n=1 Tax=Sphingomonas sp. TaxID=28214 RepID=UPI0025CBF0E5|nr:sugar transferase [Sphingomonas sp.]MBY0284882.1 sugar transferase [Sphingomonas sp.]
MLMQLSAAVHPARGSTVLASLRLQIVTIWVGAVLLPAAAIVGLGIVPLADLTLLSSMFTAAVALAFGQLMIRRVSSFPGARAYSFILPSLAGSFGAVIVVMLLLRVSYTRSFFGSSFVMGVIIAFMISYWVDRFSRVRFHVVPEGREERIASLLRLTSADWPILSEADTLPPRREPIVADLGCDLGTHWERMLARAALAGHAVYDAKQLSESLSGQVTIEHISENSFGSLLPNDAYLTVKRIADVVGCVLLLPVLLIPLTAIAIAIRLDSPGNVFFVQERMGYRGRVFRMVKFRTMRPRPVFEDSEAARADAMTRNDDDRITRVGRFLRRCRADELPQILNVLKGDMSIIGPRPEALALSQWYESEIPFYSYRHIVRPGITGWAQINQGHVTDLDSIAMKLSYDFYYIKYFSAWIDIIIVMKTVPTVLKGLGAR